MQVPFNDLKLQYHSIKKEIDAAVKKIIDNTSFINGEIVTEFENNFAKEFDVKHCVGVGNGTDAIVIALKTLGIGSGDEVITVANTFIASSEAISAVGAKVVFVDCDPNSYTIDTSKIEEKITSKTKAIIPVHLYGQAAEMHDILQIAQKNNLYIIEDSAQAHLSEYKTKENGWQKVGSFGDFATFSFYPGKNLGAYGDAGAILTNNDELAKKARMFANHGRISKYDHEFEGLNSRLDSLQAAVLNVKLKYLKTWTNQRRKIAKYYSEALRKIPEVNIPKELDYSKHVYHLYVVRVKTRDELKSYLSANGISSGIHYPIALPSLSAYKYLKYNINDFPFATKYSIEILSLPIYPEMKKEQMEYVVNKIDEFYKTVK